MWYIIYLLIFLFSFFITLILVRFLREKAIRWNFIDHPNERKIHKKPMPLLGGAAIFFGFWLTIGLGLLIAKLFPYVIPEDIKIYIQGIWMRLPWLSVIFIGGLIISCIGLWDDKFVMGARQKLFFQFIAALFTVLGGIKAKLFLPAPIDYLLSIFWILLITNAFNLLDNMDGVSAGIALISCVLLFAAAIIMGNYFIAAMLSVFIGAVFGFLCFNFPPASIFMGDCGSNFIGYIISVITILGTYYKSESPTVFSVIIPLLILAVPIFDLISVICIRIKRKKSIFCADKNHFSHRLVSLGMGVKSTVFFLYLLAFCVGLPSLLLPSLSLTGAIIVFSQAIGIMVSVALLEYYVQANR